MIPKAEFFEWIENYCLEQLSEKEKQEFETELKHNSDLMEELKLHKEIAQAISEKEISNLENKLKKFPKDATPVRITMETLIYLKILQILRK